MYIYIKKIIWVFLLVTILIPSTTLAANGTPNSSSFGYGVRVDLQGANPHAAIQQAGKFNLDWIAVDFNWQHFQPEAEKPPTWQDLDAAMALAGENQLSVMVSITNRIQRKLACWPQIWLTATRICYWQLRYSRLPILYKVGGQCQTQVRTLIY